MVGSRWSVVGGVAVAVLIAVVVLRPEREVTPIAAEPVVQQRSEPSQEVEQTLLAAPKPREGGSGSPAEPDRVGPATEGVTARAVPPTPVPVVAPIELPAVAAFDPIAIDPIETFDAVTLPMIVVEMIDIDPMELPP